ncbi:MAG: recombinase family protein [Candidatus Eremiobacteraeota bacterium]|nr:recombinase family protein [Candidatus Eremiobacteraeota bacterium]
MVTCILCDRTEDVESRLIKPRFRDPAEGLTAKPICRRCYDQFNWKVPNIEQIRSAGGKLGYGYRSVNGRVMEIPEEIAVIEAIIEMRNCGETYQFIAEHLEEIGAPTKHGGYWTTNFVSRLYARESPGFDAKDCRWYGYETDTEGNLVPKESEQAVIRWILSERNTGRSYQTIADALNRQEIPGARGGRWYPSTVSNVYSRERICREAK